MCDPWDASLKADEVLCRNYLTLDNEYKGYQGKAYQEYLFVPRYYKVYKDFDKESNLLWPAPNGLTEPYIFAQRGLNNSGVQKGHQDALLTPPERCTRDDVRRDDAKCCKKEYQAFNNLSKRRSGMVYF